MHSMTYRHCVTEGSYYEAGYKLGTWLSDDKKLIRELTSPIFNGSPLPPDAVEQTAALFEKYIPGINEEIKGFSDAAGVSYLDMVIYSSYINIPGGCSHFVTMQNDSGRKSIIHARNYDYGFDETPILFTNRINGKNSSTGFGCKVFGRFDGMNDKGLCVTTSSVDVNHTGVNGNGFIFPMMVRAMLDQCADAYEAKEMLMEMPYAEYRNFLISDKNGAAILVEASPWIKTTISIDADIGFLCSADHFTLKPDSDVIPVRHSLVRQQRMEEELTECISDISLEKVKKLLSDRYPAGLAFPYYEAGMGTLWSMIFEPRSLTLNVCYGSPETGSWRLINQNEAPGCTQTEVLLENACASEDFWN